MVDLGGYVIVLVEHKGKIKLLGSAAERTDCDEILEINGKSLESATHQEIIQHIHQCIRTRTICLRVKRRTSGKLAIDSSLVDAFVIGSRAREHLHRIARDTSITPRDIAQLSRILSETEDSSRFNQTKDTEASSKEDKDYPKETQRAQVSSSLPQSPSKQKQLSSSTSLQSQIHQQQQQQSQQPSLSSTESSSNARQRHSCGSLSIPNETEKSLIGKLIKSNSDEGDIEYYELSDENMELVELNTKNLSSGRSHIGHHREVPVDVPESFVGIVKQKPRYPPPPQHRISVHQPSSTSTTTTPAPTTTTTTTSSSNNATTNNTTNSSTTAIGSSAGGTKAKSTASPSSSSSKTQIEAEKLRKYSEDISRKKAEEEFLRSSLRNSKKLQQLEHKRKANEEIESGPAVNDAFEGDDEVFEQNKILPSIDLHPILERVEQQLNDELKEAISKTNLAKLVAVYISIMQQKQKQHSLPSVSIPATDLVGDIVMLLQKYPDSSEAAELLEILTRFELEGLCFAFDRIVTTVKDFEMSPATAHTATTNGQVVKMETEDTLSSGLDPNVRVVRIEKSSCEPLGATVRNEPDGSVIIGRIVKGGAAEKSGLLHEGDEILEVNGIEMKGRNVNQVCDLLAEMTGTLTFVIVIRDQIAKNPSIENHPQLIHLKALFNYDPDDDVYIPCRELGICFSKGDILHVIDQTDSNWWQAYRDGEQGQSLAGLIPSVHFQLQREAMQQSMLLDSNNISAHNYKNRANKKSASSILFNCGKRYHNRRKKHRKVMTLISDSDETLTYEEVSLYYPRANIKRPIVLIGPTNIGRHELRQKLMQDSERFAAAIPHTSRPRRDGEISGIDYHFISRQSFEQDIKDGKFVEHGQFEKNYYGTSLSAIEAVVQSGKICVLNLHVQAIPMLRQGHAGAKLKPYIVFVAPPNNTETLKRVIASTYRGQEEGNNLPLSELDSIIEEARDIEARFGHHFDKVLTVTNIEEAYHELLREINALEREPQWIPSIWMK